MGHGARLFVNSKVLQIFAAIFVQYYLLTFFPKCDIMYTSKKERKPHMKIFNIRHLINEIHYIKSPHLQNLVANYLTEYVPDYFWEIGASSTGKYHPAFSQGEGGLVRHTKAVVAFANELLRMSPYCNLTPEEQDAIIAACIIHDTCKYGIEDYTKSEYKSHADNASKLFADYYNSYKESYEVSADTISIICHAILTHMGHWAEREEERPSTIIDQCVHEADYIASRNFINIPNIVEDWARTDEGIKEDIEELPF
jgi:hypothetical protein